MTPGRWARLVGMNVKRARRQFLLSAFGIAVGISSLAFFSALSAGVRQVVLGRVFHADRLEVEPAKSSFEQLPASGGIGALGGLLAGGGPRPITDEVVAELRAVPGVKAAFPRMRLQFPSKAWGGAQFFGSNRFAEVIGDGVDPEVVAAESGAGSTSSIGSTGSIGPLPFADLERPDAQQCYADADCKTPGEYCAWDVHQCQRPVPVIVSRFLVELYNSTFAGQHGLPKIGDFVLSRFKGFTFTVELGSSFMGPGAGRGTPRQRRVMLVGISDRAVNVGISFPLPYVKRWNAEYGGAEAARGYSSVTVEVADKGAITAAAAKARSLGLTVVDSGAEQAGLAITLVTLLFGLVSLAIVAVAIINIAHTFFRAVVERRREIGVLRAIGASRRDIQMTLLGEAGAVGLAGGIAGLVVARLVALGLDAASHRFVPDFPFKPDTYFDFSPALYAGVLAFAVLSCLAGAFVPARQAARLEPADALTST